MAAVSAMVLPFRAPVSADNADSCETGPLKEGIDPAHGGERFDPRHRAGFASSANESRGDAGPAIGRVQHHARQQP